MEERTERVYKKEQTLQEALGAYERADAARFHMPGHKGRGLSGFWRDELALWDVTELSITDNLHAPHGALVTAEKELAKAYGAKHSFYVVNGSTGAVQAMIFSLSSNDRLLLARDCHRSAISGAALRGIETVFVTPCADEKTRMPGMVTPDALGRALDETGATAALVTSPNAYGFAADVTGLAEAAHQRGALLLVDGAHGAHYPFSDALPMALGGIADMFAHSQHKTMDALTQAASLHLGECRIGAEQMRRALAMTETTSPSYLLMASLSWSVYMAARRDWTAHAARMKELARRISGLEGIEIPETPANCGVCERDPARIVIDVTGRGWSGYEAQAWLEERGVYVEMADTRRLVLITTPSDDPAWYERLMDALRDLPLQKHGKAQGGYAPAPRPPIRRMTLRDATFAALQSMPLESAAGRIASEPIGVYPPGIALVMPGEVLEDWVIKRLLKERAAGASLFGAQNGCVLIVREDESR